MYAQDQVVIHTARMLVQKTNVFIISYLITKKLITSPERTKQLIGHHLATGR
jgi:hypothetical protein